MNLRLASMALLCVLFTACASNKYASSYTPHTEATGTLPADAKPRIRRSRDLAEDVADLQAEGYTVLGQSDFSDELEGDEGLIEQARATGATLVLKKVTFVETRKVDKTVYKPNSTTENTTRVNPASPSATTNTTTNRGSSPTPGISTTSGGSATQRKGSIPHTVTEEIYRQQAVFLRR
jgi:hypothetical protein